MLGLTVNGFSGLPVEEPLLWMGVTWATIIVYETVYTLFFILGPGAKAAQSRSGVPTRNAMQGVSHHLTRPGARARCNVRLSEKMENVH